MATPSTATGIGLGARQVSAPALESGQIDLKPEYIGSGLAYYEPRQADRRPAGQPDRAPDRAERQGWRDHRPQLHAGPGPERVRRPQGHGRPVPPDQDERPHRRCRPSSSSASRRTARPTRCAAPSGASSTAYGIDDLEGDAALGRATRRWPRRCSARPSTSASSARRSPTSSSTAGSSSRTTSRPSRPTTSRRWSATTTWPRSDRQDLVREAPQRRLGQDRHRDAGRPVQAGHRRQEGHRRRGQDLAQGQGLRQVIATL